jgi:hypothetical protein
MKNFRLTFILVIQLLALPTLWAIGDVSIAVDASGNLYGVWTVSNSSGYGSIQSAIYSGGTWSTPVQLSTTGDGVSSPLIAVTSSGSAAAATWCDTASGRPHMAGAYYSSGSWSSPQLISDLTESPTGDFDLAVLDGTSTAVLLWQTFTEVGSTTVIKESQTTTGTWSAPIVISN